MYRLIREDEKHWDRIMQAIHRENTFPEFRVTIQKDSGVRAAVTDPWTSITDIWTAYIWRVLHGNIFQKNAIARFYSSGATGQNASYYMRNLDEIENLMSLANPPVFGKKQPV